eukprot:982242-Prymnesium_polylepis.3
MVYTCGPPALGALVPCSRHRRQSCALCLFDVLGVDGRGRGSVLVRPRLAGHAWRERNGMRMARKPHRTSSNSRGVCGSRFTRDVK